MANRVFGAPMHYVQGRGAIEQIGRICVEHGRCVGLVSDLFVDRAYGDRVRASIEAAGGKCPSAVLQSDVTQSAIDALADGLQRHRPDIVVGLGGGKSLDAAKGVSVALGTSIITIPTSASNDSPTSVSYALYGENHVMVGVKQLPRNPVSVIVDTAIIAEAPVQFLRAGMGDAISKKFEAEACARGIGLIPFGTRPLLIGAGIADLAYRTIRRDGLAAIRDNQEKKVTPAFENVVEANILMSGLGFENGGLSLSHSLTRGLVLMPGTRDAAHGFQIAWALLVQLLVEGRSDECLADLLDFYRLVGLPINLAGLGFDNAASEPSAFLAGACFTAPHVNNFPENSTPKAVASAIRRLETLTGG